MTHQKKYENVPDEELVRKSKEQDMSAFEELASRYEQKIYNLIYRIVKDPEITKDIMQETFLKVYRSLNTFKGKSKFSTWLYRIAVNFSLMHLRKEKTAVKTVSLSEPVQLEKDELPKQMPDWSNNPELEVSNVELRNQINKAIDSLPVEYKAVVVLRDIENLSNRDVGKILGLSVPAIKSRLHRARVFLRDELSEYMKGRKVECNCEESLFKQSVVSKQGITKIYKSQKKSSVLSSEPDMGQLKR
ncbi:MAG: sigma-70 family RNA polymerase sigma factor [Elusimicrobiota bacterium]